MFVESFYLIRQKELSRFISNTMTRTKSTPGSLARFVAAWTNKQKRRHQCAYFKKVSKISHPPWCNPLLTILTVHNLNYIFILYDFICAAHDRLTLLAYICLSIHSRCSKKWLNESCYVFCFVTNSMFFPLCLALANQSCGELPIRWN